MRFPLSITFAVASLILFGGSIYAHELAHKEVFRLDGIESHMSLTECFPDICVIPEENCKTEACLLANDLNEVFFYPLISFMCLIALGFFILILLSECKEELLTRILKNE